jgi:hypothetical protein
MSYFTIENLETALAVLGALSVAAALVAKATPNTRDDEWVAKAKKVLDFLSLSVRK